jgi:hypothetical protein
MIVAAPGLSRSSSEVMKDFFRILSRHLAFSHHDGMSGPREPVQFAEVEYDADT